jgi:hypothetical protein
VEIDDILEEDLLDVFNSATSNGASKSTKTNKKVDDEVSYVTATPKDDFDQLFEEKPPKKQTTKVLEIEGGDIENFAMILKELLNNKTIEITIKIKES